MIETYTVEPRRTIFFALPKLKVKITSKIRYSERVSSPLDLRYIEVPLQYVLLLQGRSYLFATTHVFT